MVAMPVVLPPGRARLSTSPAPNIVVISVFEGVTTKSSATLSAFVRARSCARKMPRLQKPEPWVALMVVPAAAAGLSVIVPANTSTPTFCAMVSAVVPRMRLVFCTMPLPDSPPTAVRVAGAGCRKASASF